MSKKKNKKKRPNTPGPSVRLSQCMIVKNEEKNIEKALSWAKKIAFEQIVVDTGSTDRTIEMAERMGAKVIHFEWINDFAAAKNFAIEQAKGEWIAMLDADEYFSAGDTKKIMPFLKYVMADPKLRDKWLVIQCPWAQLDDTGKVAEIFTQERIFRNLPEIRYEGKIHERLNVHVDFTVYGDDITIMHTGYTTTSFDYTNKIERNISMINEGLKDDPDNLNFKGYLADALAAKAAKEGSTVEIENKIDELYSDVVNGGDDVLPLVRKGAYGNLLRKFIKIPEKLEECEHLVLSALSVFPNEMDFEYYYAIVLYEKKEFIEAWKLLEKCDTRISSGEAVVDSRRIAANPKLVYNQMIKTAKQLTDSDAKLKYALEKAEMFPEV